MSRPIDPGLLAALTATTGRRRQLLALEFGGGTVRLTTAGKALQATTAEDGTVLWSAMGGLLTIGAVEEKPDLAGSGMDLTVSGVDQTVLALILGDQYRGRLARAYEVMIGDDGHVVGLPLLTCKGRMNGSWKVRQHRAQRTGASTVTISTKITDLAADLEHVSGIQMNEGSHQLYYAGDTGLANVVTLANRVVYWTGTNPIRLRPPAGA